MYLHHNNRWSVTYLCLQAGHSTDASGVISRSDPCPMKSATNQGTPSHTVCEHPDVPGMVLARTVLEPAVPIPDVVASLAVVIVPES